MPEVNLYHGQALKRATLAALIEAAGAVPGVGPLLKSAGTFYQEMAEATRDLPADARRALEEIAADYKALLQREAPRNAPQTLEVALVETFAILAGHGLPANELVTSLKNLGDRLSELDRPKDALMAYEEAVRTLAPFFLRLPAAFASRMEYMARDYLEACQTLSQEPDGDLLGPVVEVLQGLAEAEGE